MHIYTYLAWPIQILLKISKCIFSVLWHLQALILWSPLPNSAHHLFQVWLLSIISFTYVGYCKFDLHRSCKLQTCSLQCKFRITLLKEKIVWKLEIISILIYCKICQFNNHIYSLPAIATVLQLPWIVETLVSGLLDPWTSVWDPAWKYGAFRPWSWTSGAFWTLRWQVVNSSSKHWMIWIKNLVNWTAQRYGFLSMDDKFKTSDLKFGQQPFYDDMDLCLPFISVEIKFTEKKTFSLFTQITWSVDLYLDCVPWPTNGYHISTGMVTLLWEWYRTLTSTYRVSYSV